ncbi:ankyrin repeat domain-containing protein [Mucilaginibacter sp. McL0603]|uniref:ankyrin repeat domain-containing protein n=1 Tax=Mucilaginibacter sp. McL0603 TaxID=3415670 RepID=UPI003CFAF3CF
MRLILIFPLLFFCLTTLAQNVTNHPVEPKGVYKEISLSNDIRVIQLLADTNVNHSKSALIDSVERDANRYTPPVLYILSNVLFSQKKYNEACYWFYLAQLRARYDVNRCTDKTANADAYNMNFGPFINDYAFHHLDSLKIIVQKVVDFVRVNDELYDQRWINLTGMDAMTASLSDKSVSKKLSIDKSQWPAIKKKTIDDYCNDFKAATNRDITVDKETLLGGDYRLFQNTPAWELAKAVKDEDTSKIKEEISKNKSLLNFGEPRFGQTLLLMAVKTLKFESAKTLVSLGANPNDQDKYDGSSPLMEAAHINFLGNDTYGSDPRYLKLLLEHGGDPNAEQKGTRRKGNGTRYTPLLRACAIGNFDYVKILVDAGANVNYNNEFSMSPLGEAVIVGSNPDVVIYLIEKGADYKRSLLTTVSGKKLYITDILRDWLFDLGSDKYKKKMELVDFLKKNGMDYWKIEIPEQYLDDYPKSYLEKY